MDKCREAFENVFPGKSIFGYIEYDAKFNVYGSKDDLSGEEPIGLFTAIANLNGAWWAWQSRQAEVEEKDKRIEELELALTQIKSWESHPKNYGIDFGSWGLRDFYRDLADKALRGKDQYTEHRSKAEQQINKGARLTKHQIDLGDNNANS